MASSKVVALPTNPDQPRDSTSSSSSSSFSSSSSSSISLPSSHNSLSTLFLHHHPMDDLLNSIYPSKTADDVWKEIVSGNPTGPHHHHNSGGGSGSAGAGEGYDVVTLEEYLNNNIHVNNNNNDDNNNTNNNNNNNKNKNKNKNNTGSVAGAGADAAAAAVVGQFGNGVEGGTVGGTSGGKGKRRVVEETVDKATLQKQRRMIKNRESAARSRERKQAYTTELEFLVHQLEQEQARLLSEEADKQKQSFKQLMECIIPIEERPGPPKRRFRRTDSAQSL